MILSSTTRNGGVKLVFNDMEGPMIIEGLEAGSVIGGSCCFLSSFSALSIHKLAADDFLPCSRLQHIAHSWKSGGPGLALSAGAGGGVICPARGVCLVYSWCFLAGCRYRCRPCAKIVESSALKVASTFDRRRLPWRPCAVRKYTAGVL